MHLVVEADYEPIMRSGAGSAGMKAPRQIAEGEQQAGREDELDALTVGEDGHRVFLTDTASGGNGDFGQQSLTSY